MTNYALQEVVRNGTATSLKSLGSDLNLAGKTGTTNDYRDAWFAGYSGNYVSVVWVGRDDNKPIGLSGGSGALPVWKDFMGRLRLTPVELVRPDSVEWLWLENGTGKLSHESCEGARYLPVLSRYLPEEASDCAIALYQQEQARRQMEWLNDQRKSLLEQSRQLDSVQEGAPSNNGDNVNNQNGASADDAGNGSDNNSENSGNTWYDKALEWF